VGQTFHLLRSPVTRECLKGCHDLGVQDTSALLEQGAVRHLVRQRMLEGLLALRKEARLVQKLGRLEVGQPPMQRHLGELSNGLQQQQGHLAANHGRHL